MKDYYDILGVSTNALQSDIKEQYRFLLHAWHPDKFPSPSQKIKAEEKTKGINEAYGVLSNPTKRAQYDRERSLSSSRVHKNEEEYRQWNRQAEEEARRQTEEEQLRRSRADAERRRAEEERREEERVEAIRRQVEFERQRKEYAEQEIQRAKNERFQAEKPIRVMIVVAIIVFGAIVVFFFLNMSIR